MAPRFTWEGETARWMSTTMPRKSGSSHSVCPLTRVQCPMSPVCPTESTLYGKIVKDS